MSILETIEWTQYWVEDTARDRKRVLLIGDSISVGYRSAVHSRIKDRYYVSAISTSKAVDNPNFVKEIDFLAREEEFEYEIVHFNNGLHGFHLSDADYEKGYDAAVKSLRAAFPNARLMLALSTPIADPEDPSAYDEKNAVVLRRNRVVEKIAAKYGLEVNDLYSVADAHPECRNPHDGYHYRQQGYDFLADQIASVLLK